MKNTDWEENLDLYSEDGHVELMGLEYQHTIDNNIYDIGITASDSTFYKLPTDDPDTDDSFYAPSFYVTVHWRLHKGFKDNKKNLFDLGLGEKEVTKDTWKKELLEVAEQIPNANNLTEFEKLLEDLGFEISY